MFGASKDKSLDVGRTLPAAQYLAAELERLMALPLSTKAEVAQWYAESRLVEAALGERFPSFGFYHEIWHFFADADIRARDTGYRDYQHGLMAEYVADLRNGSSNT